MPDDLRQAEATKIPEMCNLNLQPKNASMLEDYAPGETVSLAIRGKVSNLNLSEYGSSISIEIDTLAIREPEPENFVEEMDAMKVLKA